LKTGAGYASLKVADAVDKGDGFIEIQNQALTQANGKTTVTFDVTFDAATYSSQKITGAVVDLKYAYASVANAQVSSIQFVDPVFGGKLDVWDSVVTNLTSSTGGNGKIALIAKGSQDEALAAVNPIITTGTGKTMGVTLIINSLVDSFNIGFDLPTDSPAGLNSLSLADKTTVTPTVGISKTARLAGASSSTVVANTLEVVKDTGTLGTVTDNQFRYLETVNADGKTGSIQFQYDTNSAVGAPTLSDIVKVNLISADNLATFFAADHYKVI
jgi:hypothetical protein